MPRPTHACNAQIDNQIVKRVLVVVFQMKQVLSASSEGCTDLLNNLPVSNMQQVLSARSQGCTNLASYDFGFQKERGSECTF